MLGTIVAWLNTEGHCHHKENRSKEFVSLLPRHSYLSPACSQIILWPSITKNGSVKLKP